MESKTLNYEAAGEKFSLFMEAVAFAKTKNASVVVIATGSTCWTPAPAKNAKKVVRHFLVNADGSQTEFSKVRR